MTARLGAGAPGIIVGGATSGDVAAVVVEATAIEMDEVRGQRRSVRDGYLVGAATAPGDSRAGLYDADGRLAGLLFAVSTGDGDRSWVTAAGEIRSFLDEPAHRGAFACDPARSAVGRTG